MTFWLNRHRVEEGGIMSRRRILFVDDEPNMLSGMRNVLRKQRDTWDMVFVLAGTEALAAMDQAPFDVIVADMRMPGMDGPELLNQVKAKFPRTVRIILSGQADREALGRAMAVAHQFLSKPSDADAVKLVIERACGFQALMDSESVQRVVGAIDGLPSLPRIHSDLNRTLESSASSIADIAAIVESDPAISLKVLQLANSAYFGMPQKTDSISKAVSYLGLENLKGLVLAAHVFRSDGNTRIAGVDLDELRDESVLTANLARKIAKTPKQKEAAFTAGLVHDIGKLILGRGLKSPYAVILDRQRVSCLPLREVEQEALGATHGAAGAYLLGVWGLPVELAEIVAFHDCPSKVKGGESGPLGAVHLAAGLAEAAMAGKDPSTCGALDCEFLRRADLWSEVGKWRAEAEAQIQSSKPTPRCGQ
jgi:HD-like signal output (HDOD) protein/CheY-like chemotaxis protein